MDNHGRYLKYKNKYLNLQKKLIRQRKQRGGAKGMIFPLEDEIHFWGRQLMEHTLFLYLGLEDGDHSLKNEAFELHQTWKKYMQSSFYDKGIIVNLTTIVLTKNDLAKITNIRIDQVNDLIEKTEVFTNKIIEILNTGLWIGWIFPWLAKHMLKETIYFKRKINGPEYSVDEEIHFANDHHAEELGVTAQLIDPEPAQQKIIDIVKSYVTITMSELKNNTEPFPKSWTAEDEAILKGLESSDQATFLALSIKYGDELTQFADDTGQKIESNQLKSIISPILAHHVHREFARFTETLKKLQ